MVNTYTPIDDDYFVKVSEAEDKEFIEVPTEEDDTIDFSLIRTQYADATGLKYKDSATMWQMLLPVDDTLLPPKGGWGQRVYYIMKSDENNNSPGKNKEVEILPRTSGKVKDKTEIRKVLLKQYPKVESQVKTKKLFIANLPQKNCTEDDLWKYFQKCYPRKYGTIKSIQLVKKIDGEGRKTNVNKGYGFIMVSSEELADMMAIKHAVFEYGGRRVELRKSVPNNSGFSLGDLAPPATPTPTTCYVNVSDGDELVELPTEHDGKLLLSTVQSQFPSAIVGLKYKTVEGKWRGIRLVDEQFHPPPEGWGEQEFVVGYKNQEHVSHISMDPITVGKKMNELDDIIPDLMSLNISSQSKKDHEFPSLPFKLSKESTDDSSSIGDVDEEIVPISKNKFSEKVDYLMEMFPDVPEAQLRRSLSKVKRGNIEKAVQMILNNTNGGMSKKLVPEEAPAIPREVTEKIEKDIGRLAEMFPRLSESRIRDRYKVVGNNLEKAMRVILQEEQARSVGHQGQIFQVHKASFKKEDISIQDQSKFKQETLSKYFYMVDDTDKEHHPVILGKKDPSSKVVSLLDEAKNINMTDDSNSTSSSTSETSKVKPNNANNNTNPKLNRKKRYR